MGTNHICSRWPQGMSMHFNGSEQRHAATVIRLNIITQKSAWWFFITRDIGKEDMIKRVSIGQYGVKETVINGLGI